MRCYEMDSNDRIERILDKVTDIQLEQAKQGVKLENMYLSTIRNTERIEQVNSHCCARMDDLEASGLPIKAKDWFIIIGIIISVCGLIFTTVQVIKVG